MQTKYIFIGLLLFILIFASSIYGYKNGIYEGIEYGAISDSPADAYFFKRCLTSLQNNKFESVKNLLEIRLNEKIICHWYEFSSNRPLFYTFLRKEIDSYDKKSMNLMKDVSLYRKNSTYLEDDDDLNKIIAEATDFYLTYKTK